VGESIDILEIVSMIFKLPASLNKVGTNYIAEEGLCIMVVVACVNSHMTSPDQ
jgi:hypothetical protein